jgi:hypothetical protein
VTTKSYQPRVRDSVHCGVFSSPDLTGNAVVRKAYRSHLAMALADQQIGVAASVTAKYARMRRCRSV